MLDANDAKAVTIPMWVLASKDEEPADVAAFQEALRFRNHVETFGNQIHGWIGARGDLEDDSVRADYVRGYETVLNFFTKQW